MWAVLPNEVLWPFYLLKSRPTKGGVFRCYACNPDIVVSHFSFNCRLNRIDRLPFILPRWRGKISIAIYLEESELHILEENLSELAYRRNIVYTFYIRKEQPSVLPSFLTFQNTTLLYPNGLYPMNILRDLSIEAITTSHYVLLDIDILMSSTLESSIQKNQHLLSDHSNILLLPLFEMTNSDSVMKCRQASVCNNVLDSPYSHNH